MKNAARIPVLTLLLALALAGCSRHEAPAPTAPDNPAAGVDETRIANADAEPGNWYTTGRGFGEQRFSPLGAINAGNVKQLGFAWQYDLATRRGLEATPLVIDGVLFVSSAWSRVYALDAETGRELWRFDPHVPGEWARNACCDVVNRGVAVWQGKVFVGTLDGRLIALDAASGKPLWSQDTFIDRNRSYTITGAPRIARGKVIIGNGGGEIGVRGYISAYDAETGVLAWRFFTVPGDPARPQEHTELEKALPTWSASSLWSAGLGGTAWDSMVYDPKLGLLYVGTGNGNPHPAATRSPGGGDNLYLASILALDPDTGRMRWHYQTTPGDSWDYTATQNMILADLTIDGVQRQVLMQAPKNGFFYVLDRATGQLLSAQKYVRVDWASHVDLVTGKPVPAPGGDYRKAKKVIAPSTFGGHNWQPMAYSPATGLVYIPAIEAAQHFAIDPAYPGYVPHLMNNVAVDDSSPPDDDTEVPWGGALKAWDPVAQREVWRIDYPFAYNGGLVATAGNLVLQGTTDGFLKAYAADTGKLLAQIEVGTSIMAAPAVYAVKGTQYVAVLAGFGGALANEFEEGSAARRHGNAGRIVVFKLGGGAVPLPPSVDWNANLPPLPARLSTDRRVLAQGARLFELHCSACHRRDDDPNVYPSLMRLTPEKLATFDAIVRGGALAPMGMAGFGDVLGEQDAAALKAWIVDRTHTVRRR